MALTTQAVERYTLDELTSPEREEFEEHFFSCQDCVAALHEYETFAANARAVFKDDEALANRPAPAPAIAQQGWRPRLSGWFGIKALAPAFVALALAFVLFRPPDPAGAAFAWTLAADVRDKAPHLAVDPKTVWLVPTVDLVAGPNQPNRWKAYHWEVRNADGRILDQSDGHDGRGELTLKIPASKFESGKEYKLIVQGDATTGPISGSFVIDRK
jgi:hypothetical protein